MADDTGLPRDLRAARSFFRTKARGRPRQPEPVGPGQESVWDYPRPPRVLRSDRPVRIEFGGRVIARSERAWKVQETASPPVYYVPRDDVDESALVPSDRHSFCEWKGVAHYVHVEVDGRRSDDAAWFYPQPDRGFEALRDHLAFYPGRVDGCFLGDERVRPQPGPFYGGWVTDEIRGPFKGEPGTEGW